MHFEISGHRERFNKDIFKGQNKRKKVRENFSKLANMEKRNIPSAFFNNQRMQKKRNKI